MDLLRRLLDRHWLVRGLILGVLLGSGLWLCERLGLRDDLIWNGLRRGDLILRDLLLLR